MTIFWTYLIVSAVIGLVNSLRGAHEEWQQPYGDLQAAVLGAAFGFMAGAVLWPVMLPLLLIALITKPRKKTIATPQRAAKKRPQCPMIDERGRPCNHEH